MLFNRAPKQEDFASLDEWAKAHITWKCQKEGWTYLAFDQFCEKVKRDVYEGRS